MAPSICHQWSSLHLGKSLGRASYINMLLGHSVCLWSALGELMSDLTLLWDMDMLAGDH